MKRQELKHKIKMWLLLSIFTFTSLQCLAQSAISPYIGVSEEIYSFYPSFLATNLYLGAQFEIKPGYLTAYGIYQLHGNLETKELPSFIFASHLAGIGAEYRSNKDKRFAFVLGFSALTEVKSNFRNGYLKDGIPSLPSKKFIESHTYENSIEFYYSNDFYHSTPFSGNIWLGCDFRIIQGLNINISLVNNTQIIKMRHLDWDIPDFDDQTVNDAINKQPIKTVVLDQNGLRFSLSYTVPLKKKESK